MRLMKAALFSSAFALIAAGASPVAIAAPNNGGQTAQQRCEAGGHLWDSVKGCANKTCSSGGRTYQPGDVRQVRSIKGRYKYFLCDGFTGQWEAYA